MKKFWLCVLCLFVLSQQGYAQTKISMALFNLTPESIDAIGMDGDLLFSIRQELEKSSVVALMSRRQMEEGLYRINGSQVSDTAEVVTYGKGLGVNYILTGSMNVVPGSIDVNFKLVDAVNGVEAAKWRESFKTNLELVSKAAAIARKIEQSLLTASTTQAAEVTTSVSRIAAFSAQANDGNVNLSWENSSGQSVFYYNIYRGESSNGPFEFVGSVTEPRYRDTSLAQSGNYVYRIGVILESGEEVRGGKLASVSVNKMRSSRDLSPPTVLGHEAFVNGIALDFVPSVSNRIKLTGFRLYRRRGQDPWETVTFIEHDDKISYKVTYLGGLLAGSSYDFAMTSVGDGDVESPMSSPVVIQTAKPVLLETDNAILTRQVNLLWGEPASHNVKIYRREKGEESWQSVGEVNAGAMSYSDKTALQDGKEYEYSASLFDAKTESTKSNIVQATTKLLPAPTAFSVAMGVKSATLSWTPVEDSDAVAYRIYRKEGDLNKDDLLDEVATVKGQQSAQFVDGIDNGKPLKDGMTYHYLIAALNAFDGVGEVTPTQTVGTKPLPPAVEMVTAQIGEADITVQWQASAVDDIQEYQVLRKWNNEPWQLAGKVDSETYSYVDANLKPYAQTQYQVVGMDADGLKSQPSNVANVLSPDRIVLNVSAEGLARQVNLSWSSHHNISGYKLYRRVQGDASWRQVADINSSQTTQYEDADPKNMRDGLRYEYAVSAFDANIETIKSQPVSAITKGLPTPPSSFSGVDGQVKKVSLTWQATQDPDVKGYKLYRVEENGKLELLLETKNTREVSYVDEGSFFSKLDDGTVYTYRISSVNRFNAEGEASAPIQIQTKPLPPPVDALTADEVSGAVALNWQPSVQNDISYYQVYRGSTCNNLRKHNRASTQSYTDNKAAPGKSYCYRITAIDAAGLEGTYSAPVKITLTAPAEGGE